VWFVHVSKALTRQDHRHWRRFIVGQLPRDGIAIDVRAHGGQFTRLLSKLTPEGPEGLIIAVEPSSYARVILGIALWVHRARNVVVVAAGLGRETSVAMIRTPIKRHGDMGYGLATLTVLARESVAEPVAIVKLDDLTRTLDLPALHLIKADIEGSEAALISGATDPIAKYRPSILLEMSDPLLRRSGSSLAELWGQMIALGYTPLRVPDGTGDLVVCTEGPRDGDIIWLPDHGADSA
jgi:FkbM family methyltransferase